MTKSQNALLVAAIQEFQAKVLDAFESAEAAHAETIEDAEETVAAAKEFVIGSNLFGAALEMYESTHHYHAWCKHDDWTVWNVIGVTNVKEQPAALPESSGFNWGGHAWVFSLGNKRPSYSGDETYATLSVEFDGEAVMELRVVTDHRSEFYRWRLVDVNMLSVGPWAAALTEMAATMKLTEQHRQLEEDAEILREQAAHIKL